MRLIGLAVILAVSVILAPLVGEAQQAGPSKVGLLFLGTAGIDSTERSGIAVRRGCASLGGSTTKTSTSSTDTLVASAIVSINWSASWSRAK